MANFLSKILSFGSDKELKEYRRITDEVNALEPRFHAMICRREGGVPAHRWHASL